MTCHPHGSPLAPRVRRSALGILGTLVMCTACGNGAGPDDGPPPLNGRYALETVDGRALPFLLGSTTSTELLLVADTVTVSGDRDVLGVNVNHSVSRPGGTVTVSRVERRGTWRRVSALVVVPDGAALTDTIFLSGTGYRLRTGPFATCAADPCNWVYRRLP